jgi:hypothetical protein
MPSEHKVLITLRGTDQYARYLAKLERAVRKRGVQLGEGPNALAEHALAILGYHHELKAPERVPPQGTNRHGRPKKIPEKGVDTLA